MRNGESKCASRRLAESPETVARLAESRNAGDGDDYGLPRILHSLKLHTALEGNRLLGPRGAFWQHESYDHFVRDAKEWERIVADVLNNPVKAGLVEDGQEWCWSWYRYAP